MAQIEGILDRAIEFNPAGDFDEFLRSVPAKWAVYLFADGNDQPVQLLCVKNLRYSLKRRLSGETISLSKRVEYREIVRKIRWCRVDSAFEADHVYQEAARLAFPNSYQGMIGFRPAWFIHVDPDAPFPRYIKTIELTDKSGVYIGPLEDKHAAARLIELIEDAFDLCRYFSILVDAPEGRACAYKEMGKCPAPCDGSITLPQYRRLVEWSAQTLADPRGMIHQQTQRMQQAALELRFETAAKIKAFIDQLSQLGKGPFRHARPLPDFSFMALQPGPAIGKVKLFLILPGVVEEIADLIAEPQRPSEILRNVFAEAEARSGKPLDGVGVERMGIVAHHLFSPKNSRGILMPLDEMADPSGKALLKAYRTVAKSVAPAEEPEVEGVVKDLQAM